MSIKAIIGILVALVVIGGGAWYLSNSKGTTEGMNQQGTRDTENQLGDEGTTTFEAFLALGGSRECQVTVEVPEAPATGTVYVSGADIRSDIVAKPANVAMEITAHMIRTGGYIYTWTDIYPQGVKIKESEVDSSEDASANGYDPNAQVKYTCKAWVPDASKFEVPTSVTFKEFAGSVEGSGSVPTPN